MSEFKCPKCGAVLTVEVKNEKPKAALIEDVKRLFPRDLEEMLTFEDSAECLIVRPRQFLGSDNFAKIAAIVREAKGEYISAGKESHFKIPKV